MKKIALAVLLAAPAFAFAATYSVGETAQHAPEAKLVALGETGCVYASQPVALGDILSYPDGSRQVCASGDRGPRFVDIVPARPAKS